MWLERNVMSKHKSISKKKRLLVYDKCNGHCAYCGCELEFKDMQVDHIESVWANVEWKANKTLDEINDLGNLMPSCRMCNFYKSSASLEKFRQNLTDVLMPNVRKPFDYRLALKYGLIEEHIKPITFYFETL